MFHTIKKCLCFFDTIYNNKDLPGFLWRKFLLIGLRKWPLCPTDMKLGKNCLVVQICLIEPGFFKVKLENIKKSWEKSVGRSSRQRDRCWTATYDRLLCIRQVKKWKIRLVMISRLLWEARGF